MDNYMKSRDTRIIPADIGGFTNDESTAPPDLVDPHRTHPRTRSKPPPHPHNRPLRRSEMIIRPESIYVGRGKDNRETAKLILPGGTPLETRLRDIATLYYNSELANRAKPARPGRDTSPSHIVSPGFSQRKPEAPAGWDRESGCADAFRASSFFSFPFLRLVSRPALPPYPHR